MTGNWELTKLDFIEFCKVHNINFSETNRKDFINYKNLKGYLVIKRLTNRPQKRATSAATLLGEM